MSKLGVHISAGNRRGFGEFLKKCAEAGSPVPVVLSVDQDVWPDIERYSPTTLVVFRHQVKDQDGSGLDGPADIYVGDPIQSARGWMTACMESWRKNRANYYAPLNEQDPASLEAFDWLEAFTIECLAIADVMGFKLALYGFSAGNPKSLLADGRVVATPWECWARLVSSLQYAKAHGHILLLHEYGFDLPAANGGPAGSLRASAPWMALRYRESLRYLKEYDADPPVVIGEASAGVGYDPGFGDAAWLADAAWYDSELMKNGVIGACLYQLGGAENFYKLLPALGDYIADAPTLAPPAPPDNPLAYDRTTLLLHPSQYTPSWSYAAFRPDCMWTVSQSPHDAFDVGVNQKSRRIIAINSALWGTSPTLAEWAAANYPPGYMLIDVAASSPMSLYTEIDAALMEAA